MTTSHAFIIVVGVFWLLVLLAIMPFALKINKQLKCPHNSRMSSSPAGQDFVELLQNKITMEQYRKRKSPMYISTCLDCGKVTEQ